MASKTELRKTLRSRRRALSPQAQRIAAQQLGIQLQKLALFHKAKHVAAYWPSDGEISPLPFLHKLQSQGKHIYLPEVLPNGLLQFRRYHMKARLSKNVYGIPEPISREQQLPQNLDIVLMPLVGFDQSGHRLGMGGGYYDKTFAFLRQQRWRKKPVLIGLAHHFQQLETLHNDNWDIPLNCIVSDRRQWISLL